MRIGNGSEFMTLRVLGRSYPAATDDWYGNWVDAEVEVSIPPWQAVYPASLRTNEFVSFRRDLETMNRELRGSASFSPLEPWINLILEIDQFGHIKMSGMLVLRSTADSSALYD